MMFIAALVMASGLWGQQTEKLLTLEECILSAVKNNLDVAVQILNPQISDTAVAIANQKFLPQLSFNFNTRSTNQASFSWIQSAGAVSTESRDYYAQIQQAIPTGGNFTIQLYSQKTDSNQKYQTINPYYYSQLTFDFNQPLLKNFGFKYSRREILIAKTNRGLIGSVFTTRSFYSQPRVWARRRAAQAEGSVTPTPDPPAGAGRTDASPSR